jgi:methylmalonyl-CoA/ethylmalonyl-CoA epimerase
MREIAALGEVMQIAFVPSDFDAALDFWTKTMGVGPFYLQPNLCLPGMLYRGQPSAPVFSVAIAYWGEIQIELIQQHNDAPSIYRDWRAVDGSSMHHTCLVVPDIAHARTVCEQVGGEIVQEAAFPVGGVIYVDTGGGPGTIVEIIQPGEATRTRFATMKAASRDWDGSEPLRRFG